MTRQGNILTGILPFTHGLHEKIIQPGDIVVDATMGNGHDTLFLAKLVGESGRVFAYDIQEQALDKTRKRLTEHHCIDQVTLCLKGHETVNEELQTLNEPLTSATFNLGYLPGGDKQVVTRASTTIKCLHSLAQHLKPSGLITLVIYTGHDEGKVECQKLLDDLNRWDQTKFHILRYEFMNQQNNPPFLIAIEKR